MKKVSCVIITYNIGIKIKEVYNSLKNQVDDIIFVDNNSDKETKEILKKIDTNTNCTVIFNESNVGIAKALNIGIKIALKSKADFILTLDHDSILEENSIKKMLDIYDNLKEKNVGVLCPAIYDINKKDYLTEVKKTKVQFITEPIQSGSLIKSELFNDIGLFNEELFIYYVDTDFCLRGLKKGYKFIQCNDTVLRHEEGKKTKHTILGKNVYYNNYSTQAVYYRARNNVYMFYKYRKEFSSRDRLLKDFIKIIICDCQKYKKLKGHFKGIRDGIKMVKNIKIRGGN